MNMGEYKLVWSDEFDGGGIDLSKWDYETGGHGWGNNEKQYYTKNAGNVFVGDGKLHLVAKKEDYDKNNYTSGKISTYGKASWKYCYVEASAKVPRGLGTWPAIWMLSDSIRQGTGWPLCGEIDILEHVGADEGTVHASLHSALYNHSINTQQHYAENMGNLWDGFHTYAIEWTEDYVDFLFDGKSYVKYIKGENGRDTSDKGWPFNKNFYIILNLAAGGSFGGEIDDASLPWTFEVDYVRVYQKKS
ncbi:MAG: glycoside hydrolase family 16 protein [Oscillospiraceae bacterium]|nr:glycoside hydrolase family 16 protein [Oscillospiraceae bacterium]